MNEAFILMGGNVGNRLQHLKTALELISIRCGSIVRTSSVYQTAPWGNPDQQDFLNQAILLQTELHPQELMKQLLMVEQRMGRIRDVKYGERNIDLDILFYNDEIINERHLTIPHPQIPNRRFVLVPMAELNPGFVHPVLHKTIAELLETCPDDLPVLIYE